MKIEFTKKFFKQYKKAPKKIKAAFQSRLKLFVLDKHDPILNNHSLTGSYKRFRSINVTGNWRALFQEFESGQMVFFEFIGTHSQLYK